MQADRTQRFRALLQAGDLAFAMEAHNGLSAKIVEEAGFSCIWASGFAIATSLGLRDCNEASWTQVVDIVDYMADATSIPILMDGDTGGDFNMVRRLVRKASQRGIAAICLEDKTLPKRNSFSPGPHRLAAIPEFCGKIRAARDSKLDPSFCVVARTEGFIAGATLDEVVRRAEAYVEAGADAILVHSKRRDADEIAAFMQQWDGRAPVVIVPTTYPTVPTSIFRSLGVSMVIWANHNLRGSIAAMRQVSVEIFREQSAHAVASRIASLSDVFGLVDADELAEAELRYGGAPPGKMAAE